MKGMMSAAAALGLVGSIYLASADLKMPSEAAATAGKVFNRYRLISPDHDASCVVAKGPEIESGLSEIAISGDCGTFGGDMSAAKYWRENKDGSIVFMGVDQPVILEFALSDGMAYESFRPGSPLVSLVVEED